MTNSERVTIVQQCWHERVSDEFVPRPDEAEAWLATYPMRCVVEAVSRTGRFRKNERRRQGEFMEDELIALAESFMRKVASEIEQAQTT